MKFYTFYQEKPDEENEIGLFETREEACEAAKQCEFKDFIVSEVIFPNPKRYRATYVEVKE